MSASGQLDLWTVSNSRLWSWRERYRAWRATPEGAEIWREFRTTAYALLQRGEKTGGKAIAEHLRRRKDIRGSGRHEFRINNSFISLMVDDLISDDERFDDLFERRRRKAT